MLVVAFDGLLFDTLGHRATAVVEALAAEGFKANMAVVLPLIPSRSLAEAVRAVLNHGRGSGNEFTDETALDIATHRAERILAGFPVRSAALNVEMSDKIRRAAAVTRVVVRADSKRRDVDELLVMAELDSVIAMSRCCDDALAAHAPSHAESSLRRSYDHIVRRIAANRNLLGGSSGIGLALEPSAHARLVAREFGLQTPDSWLNLPLPDP